MLHVVYVQIKLRRFTTLKRICSKGPMQADAYPHKTARFVATTSYFGGISLAWDEIFGGE
jgi:hypothetical protein